MNRYITKYFIDEILYIQEIFFLIIILLLLLIKVPLIALFFYIFYYYNISNIKDKWYEGNWFDDKDDLPYNSDEEENLDEYLETLSDSFYENHINSIYSPFSNNMLPVHFLMTDTAIYFKYISIKRNENNFVYDIY